MKSRFLRAAAVLAGLVLLTAYCAGHRGTWLIDSGDDVSSGNIAANVGILEALSAQDVDQVQAQVDTTKVTATDAEVASVEYYFFTHTADSVDPADYKGIFADCVVMGDSITTGLVDYEFLTQDQVVAQKGLTMNQAEEKGCIDMVKALSPKVIFLSFGLNDLILYKGDAVKFYNRYVSFLKEVKEACPNAKIYVNSIFPVISPMADEKTYLADIPQYNILLWYICSENNVGFIDNTAIATEDQYAEDGAHFKKSMYKYWLYDMALYAYLK